MNHSNVLMSLKYIPYMSGALIFILICLVMINREDRVVLSACHELSGMIRAKGINSVWYKKTADFLKRNGAQFHYGKNFCPSRLLVLQILCGLMGMIIGSSMSFMAGIAMTAVVWFLPKILLKYLNKNDNEKMLGEVKLVYNCLAMQIRSGMVITDALMEIYSSVSERRLRTALIDLASDIAMKSNVVSALETFQLKFDNRYIDALCITVIQALESGQAIELLNDISEQIKDMEAAVLEGRKGKLDRSITFYQLGILAATLVVILYACVRYMLDAATFL